jgi:hypothetical protein
VVNPSEDELRQRVMNGYRFIAYSIDSVILSEFLKRPEL